MNLYETNVAQVPAEFEAYAGVLRAAHVKRYLEVGSKFGGSLWLAAQALQPGSRIVAVDLPNGTKAWKESEVSLKDCIARLNAMGHDARIIWGDSKDPAIIEQVRALGPFDAAMIDGDHRLPGVTADWNNYGPMSRIVAFHDIAWRRAPEWVGVRIDVPELWDSVKGGYRREEFRFCPTGKNNGIGVLWRD